MNENCPSDVLNFGNTYIWRKLYKPSICDFEGRTITIYAFNDPPVYAFPIGNGDLKKAIMAMKEYSDSIGKEFVIFGVTETQRSALESVCPGCFSFAEDRDGEEYFYHAEKLATYSGKSLHGKKNHCNRFEAEHTWSFEPLTEALIPPCIDLLNRWEEENAERVEENQKYEYEAILCAFEHYSEFQFEGGVLIADGRIVGFTIGEFASRDTFDVHFEKAEYTMNGAYTMVCREFVRMLMKKYPQIEYINREEDLGIEGLRKSKLSYKPEFLLTKYIARWNDDGNHS